MPDQAPLAAAPPHVAGLVWRSIDRGDLPAVAELARACLAVDGGLPFLFQPEILHGRFFPDAPGGGIGAFDPAQRLGACAAVHCADDGPTQRATLVGHVSPGLRRRGLGAYLLRWSQAQAQAHFSAGRGARPVLRIATESRTEPAHRLYLAHGFECVFDELVMRRELRSPLPDPPHLPAGVALTAWRPALAEAFYQAYHAAFRERPGFPGYRAAEWIARVTADDLIPEWSLLARAGDEPLGFVLGDIDLTANPPGGYVQQIGVVPAARRQGLGSALMVESLRRMQAAGAPVADLTVHLNNPGAIEAYRWLGFATIGRRARYERVAEP